MREHYDGDEAGRCGGCGARNLITTKSYDGTTHAKCKGCGRFQEAEVRDWPESVMCDNCAWRAGSPERADPYRWAELQEALKAGHTFHCHKGLSLDLETGAFAKPDPSKDRVTVCAGWIAAYFAYLKRAEQKASA